MVRVLEVEKGSAAEAAGLKPGDRILRINGETVADFLDFSFALAEDILNIERRSGEKSSAVETVSFKRVPGKSAGIRIEEGPVFRCGNNCIFCFIDQLPRGLRKSLYVKDEDYRYGFLHGNYITGAALEKKHIERIVRMGLGPLYISVHATDPVVRGRMLGLGSDNQVMPLLRSLARRSVRLHFQVVLCPGINDGAVLDRTVADLESLGPDGVSLAVVPVGLTGHRQGLPRLEPVGPRKARETLEKIHLWQRGFKRKRGSRFVFAADELYLKGGVPIPSGSAYESFPQLGNGVGLVRQSLDGLGSMLRRKKDWPFLPALKIRIITGKLFEPVVRESMLPSLEKRVPGTFEISAVGNTLLGRSVTVAGLLPGKDILRAVASSPPADVYLIPEAALNEDNLFLDDVSLEELKKACAPSPVIAAAHPARGLEILARTGALSEKENR